MPCLAPASRAFCIAAAMLLSTALCGRCMPLPWPSEHRPLPFTVLSWPATELACSDPASSSSVCTDALLRAAGAERPSALLLASAAWRHARGDVYGSAHALRGALSLLHNSSSEAAGSAEATLLFKEILGILHRVLDITLRPPSPPSSSSPSPSPLSSLYPAQITPFSDFAAALMSVCRSLSAMRVVVEVGSGAGAGASSAIVGGILRRPLHERQPHFLRVFLIEIGSERRARLTQRYSHLPFVSIIAASAIPLDAFPSAADVTALHAAWHHAEFPLSDALQWRQQDWDYMRAPGIAHDGIGAALTAARDSAAVGTACSRALLAGDCVDVAVLDGSEFTGWQELRQIYGARVIALDDTRALKHRRSRAFLQTCGCYTAAADELHDRNGWAIFTRVPGSTCAPLP
jgi:hypothetical protein